MGPWSDTLHDFLGLCLLVQSGHETNYVIGKRCKQEYSKTRKLHTFYKIQTLSHLFHTVRDNFEASWYMFQKTTTRCTHSHFHAKRADHIEATTFENHFPGDEQMSCCHFKNICSGQQLCRASTSV
jgi:hypothetical protein